MRQAIETKYVGPTNHQGTRIVARANAGRKITHWDHALCTTENHAMAAKAFAEKFGWAGSWFGGGRPNNEGYVFVWASSEELEGCDFYVARKED